MQTKLETNALFLAVSLFGLLSAPLAVSAEWGRFRGPNGSGIAVNAPGVQWDVHAHELPDRPNCAAATQLASPPECS